MIYNLIILFEIKNNKIINTTSFCKYVSMGNNQVATYVRSYFEFDQSSLNKPCSTLN
jgi:hypothetical protein